MPTNDSRISLDPATGRLMLDGQVLDQNDPRMWGRVGRNVLDLSTAAPGQQRGEGDPRFYEAYEEDMGDGNTRMAYRLRPEYAERLNGRIQLGQSGVGGFAEAQDPSRLSWDDEFGILSDRDNVSKPDNGGMSGFLNDNIVAMMAAGMGGAVAAHGGFSGMFGGAPGAGGGGFPMVEAPNMAIPGAIPAASPAMSGLPSLAGGAGGTAGAGAAAAGGAGPMGALGAGGTGGTGLSGLGSQLGNYISSNPMGALRTGVGLASLGASMGGSSGDGNAVGSMGDILDQQANANRYDWNTPTGSRSWSQGADGRWTVNDRMSEREQANFDNVQGLNADSTGYARDLLARTMAAPRRDYAGSLPSTDSYFQRWRG